MQKFNAAGCCILFALLAQREQLSSMTKDSSVAAGTLEELRALLVGAMTFSQEADLSESIKLIRRLVREQLNKPTITHAELQWALHHLQELIISEMRERKFFSISELSAKTFDDPYPMCKEVADAFPKANYDIKEAYNCLVLDRSTAAVFHAMRIAEHGLRYLALKLRVKLTHKGKSQPIESATWDKILVEIKNRITAAHAAPHGARRQKQLAYYSDMAERCTYVKDLWRNPVMHTRRSYNKDEASGALRRVSEFMNLLAAPH